MIYRKLHIFLIKYAIIPYNLIYTSIKIIEISNPISVFSFFLTIIIKVNKAVIKFRILRLQISKSMDHFSNFMFFKYLIT